MVLDGARVYSEGVVVNQDHKERIRQIMSSIKSIAPASDFSLKLLKCGNTYEGLLWGSVNNMPVGVYNRGPTVAIVLDTLHRRAKRECVKRCQVHGILAKPKRTAQTQSQPALDLAG